MSTKTDKLSATRVERHQQLREQALQNNGGSRSFVRWKTAALNDAVDLANRAERLELLSANLYGDFELVYRIRMPVPRWPSNGELVIGDSVVFHLGYVDQWRTEPPPGWLPLGVFEPMDIFHPNSRPSLRGALCLGDLAAGIPPTELMLLGYFLASLQDYTLDEHDPHGVLNAAACEYYRCHSEYLPLTRTGLLDPWSPEGGC